MLPPPTVSRLFPPSAPVGPADPVLGMSVPPGKHLCTCTKCIKLEWRDTNGQMHHGNLYSRPKTVQNHTDADRLRAQSAAANTILLATAASSTSQQSLPVRPTDDPEGSGTTEPRLGEAEEASECT